MDKKNSENVILNVEKNESRKKIFTINSLPNKIIRNHIIYYLNIIEIFKIFPKISKKFFLLYNNPVNEYDVNNLNWREIFLTLVKTHNQYSEIITNNCLLNLDFMKKKKFQCYKTMTKKLYKLFEITHRKGKSFNIKKPQEIETGDVVLYELEPYLITEILQNSKKKKKFFSTSTFRLSSFKNKKRKEKKVYFSGEHIFNNSKLNFSFQIDRKVYIPYLNSKVYSIFKICINQNRPKKFLELYDEKKGKRKKYYFKSEKELDQFKSIYENSVQFNDFFKIQYIKCGKKENFFFRYFVD